MTELFTLALLVYLCVGFAKFMLCAPHIPLVISALSRLSGAPKGGGVYARYVIGVPFLVAVVSMTMWVAALYKEGVGFFVMYSKREVLRDCVNGYREAHAGD